MKLAVGIDQIRNYPKLYIGDYEPSGQFLGTGLAGCALTSGVRLVQIRLLTVGDDPPDAVRNCLVDAEFAVVFKPQTT